VPIGEIAGFGGGGAGRTDVPVPSPPPRVRRPRPCEQRYGDVGRTEVRHKRF